VQEQPIRHVVDPGVMKQTPNTIDNTTPDVAMFLEMHVNRAWTSGSVARGWLQRKPITLIFLDAVFDWHVRHSESLFLAMSQIISRPDLLLTTLIPIKYFCLFCFVYN
jgi:hypothetical protein